MNNVHPDDGPDDGILIAQALHLGDRAAYGILVQRHQGMVRAKLRRLTGGNGSWADDLAQEVFLHAWRKLEQFRGDSRFSTWLYRIAYTIFLQASRGKKIELQLPASDEDAMVDDGRQNALRADLSHALRQLSEAEQKSLQLCYFLDLSHDEAAYILDMPVGTVKTHIARGKIKLKELLADWAVHE